METLYQIQTPIVHEVFILSTTLATKYDVDRAAWYFDTHESILRWSIDLHDWEKILKLTVTDGFEIMELKRFLNSKGYAVSELSD